MNIAQLESEALSLPLQQRASLAHRLLLSLEEIAAESEFDQLWAEESAHRAAEFDTGRSMAVSGEEVAAKVRTLLR
jgi:putative addiction module component (TIGR02574 family)